jgi:two-component system cell cycle response regulator
MDKVAAQVITEPKINQTNEELRAENRRLNEQLGAFLEQAHLNQQIMSRHQSMDLKLIGASSFQELIVNIFDTLAQTSELDAVTLSLIDPRNSLRDILQELKLDLSEFPRLMFASNEKELGIPGQSLGKPLLGMYSDRVHARLFLSCPKKPSSVAIVPLIRQNKIIGCLNLGSFQHARFSSNMATDFIEHLGSIIAICLENVINSERLTYIGLTDALTNVSNRRYVEQRILEEIGRARRQQYSIACMYLDIDFFKKINDQYGHQSGDDVLKEVASRIKTELRLSDTLGRFGGEEFVVVLVNASAHDAAQVAERIRLSIASKPFLLSIAGVCSTSISIGIATLPEVLNQGDIASIAGELLWRADRALYDAKEQGRNRVCQSLV